MFFFTRRIIESIIIMLISSLPVYIIYKMGFIPDTRLAYFIAFAIDAVIFLVLSFFVLPAHLMAVMGSIVRYLFVNVTILAAFAAASILMLHYKVSGDLYTALFGYTKVFAAFDVSTTISAVLFWFIYLAEIVLILAMDGKGIRQFAGNME